MLPLSQKIAFLLFALITLALGFQGFYRLYLRIRRGTPDPEPRFNNLPRRVCLRPHHHAHPTAHLQEASHHRPLPLLHLLWLRLLRPGQSRRRRRRLPAVSASPPTNPVGATYNLLADILSFLVLLGVIALVIRRFALPSRRDFRFNPRTLLHKDVQHSKITRDSLIVSAFILFHVGSRAIGAGAKIAAEGPDAFQPFATLLSHLFTPANAEAFRIFGYWGALGSVLAFLAYFPYTKHIHIFMAPAKYLVAREPTSGVFPSRSHRPRKRQRERSRNQQIGAANSKISPGRASSTPTPASSATAARTSAPPPPPANPSPPPRSRSTSAWSSTTSPRNKVPSPSLQRPLKKTHQAPTHSSNSLSPPKPPGPAPPAEPAWRSAPPRTSRCSTSSTSAATRS